MQKQVIVRLKSGLGNQLFSYAAARRLALVNDAELVLDDRTGFIRDRLYRRHYALAPFHVAGRIATPRERLWPFERARRCLAKTLARRRRFADRWYLEQEGVDFDDRLLGYRIRRSVYLDGYWQSEGYFQDVAGTIREDLRIVPPRDALNQEIARRIAGVESVCIHVRWFFAPGSAQAVEQEQTMTDYYRRAIASVRQVTSQPHFFLFSDNGGAAQRLLGLDDAELTCVGHNRGDLAAHADLWLMSQCRHFIIAKSTFSWWAAWLGSSPGKHVFAPAGHGCAVSAWGMVGLLPSAWTIL